jgi:hypothetical protein
MQRKVQSEGTVNMKSVYGLCKNQHYTPLFTRPVRLFYLRISVGSRDNIFGIATGYGLIDQRVGVRVRVGSRILSPLSRPALGPTQPPFQWVLGALSPGVKRPGREAGHSQLVPRSRKCVSIHPLSHTPSWRSAELVKHRDKFIFMNSYENRIRCF